MLSRRIFLAKLTALPVVGAVVVPLLSPAIAADLTATEAGQIRRLIEVGYISRDQLSEIDAMLNLPPRRRSPSW